MKLIAYALVNNPMEIKPASPKREWMDGTSSKFAYRCLPLSIANSYGWEVISPVDFSVTWDGGKGVHNVVVECQEPNGQLIPVAAFGEGTFTIHTGHVFKTEYPYALYVTGPVNEPHDGVIPLSGIVETYWLPYTFTMNWKLTRPGMVHFKKGDVLCHIYPINIEVFDNIEPELTLLSDDEELEKLHWEWSNARSKFIQYKKINHPEMKDVIWQKNYFQGNYPPDGVRKCPVHITEAGETKKIHKTNLNVPEFESTISGPYRMPEKFSEELRQIYKEKVDG
jgi:hypothetical protein